MKLRAIWSFVAGDSRLAPLAVAGAVIVAVLLMRSAAAAPFAGVAFVAIIAGGLVASVFERV